MSEELGPLNEFFDLNNLQEFMEIYNDRNEDKLTDFIIKRPEGVDSEVFQNICNTESMKASIKYLIKSYSDERTLVDFVVIEQNEIVIGFIFVKQYKRCTGTKDTVYSIEYFCSNVKGVGKILLGFTIFSSFKKECELILQLDQGYLNLPGLCLYTSLGFKVDNSLLTNCYSFNKNRIPMVLDNSINKENLFQTQTYKDELCSANNETQLTETKKNQNNYILDNASKLPQKTKTQIIKEMDKNFVIDYVSEKFKKSECVTLQMLGELYNLTLKCNPPSYAGGRKTHRKTRKLRKLRKMRKLHKTKKW